MPNTVTIRVTAPGATEAAASLDDIRSQAADTGQAAQDMGAEIEDATGNVDTSEAVGQLENLGDEAANARDDLASIATSTFFDNKNMKAIKNAAEAFDNIAGTNLKPLADGLDMIADISEPFEKQITAGLSGVMGKLGAKLAPIGAAAGAAIGGVVGEAQALAQQAAATGQQAVTAMAAKITATGAALAPAGTAAGTAVGSAMALGAAAAVVGIGVVVADTLGHEIQKHADDWHDSLFGAGSSAAADAKTMGIRIAEYMAQGMSESDAIAATREKWWLWSNQDFDTVYGWAQQAGTTVGEGFSTGMREHIASERAENNAAYAAMGRSAGQAFTGDLADALQNNTGVIDDAMDKVAWAVEHPMELLHQKAELSGAIQQLMYSRGMASNSDEVNQVIDQQITRLQAQWLLLTGKAYGAGSDAGVAWYRGYQAQIAAHVRTERDENNDAYNQNRRGGSGGVNPKMGPTNSVMAQDRDVHVHVHLEGDAEGLFRHVDREQGRRLALATSSAYSRG